MPSARADLSIDWDFSRREIKQQLDQIRKGEEFITWVRELPVLGLWEHPKMRRRKKGMTPDFEAKPLLVDPTGLILDMRASLEDLTCLGQTMVNCEIFYPVKYLKKDPPLKTKIHVLKNGIVPQMDDEKRRKVAKLCKRLEMYNKNYPVNVVSWIFN